jgi:hypothetical protein
LLVQKECKKYPKDLSVCFFCVNECQPRLPKLNSSAQIGIQPVVVGKRVDQMQLNVCEENVRMNEWNREQTVALLIVSAKTHATRNLLLIVSFPGAVFVPGKKCLIL